MTLIKSSIPLTVYRAESPLLANITGDAIRRFAFRSIDNVPEEKACGFVNCDDMFDTEWINSIPEKGHYMAFGFQGGCKAHRSRHSEKTCGRKGP